MGAALFGEFLLFSNSTRFVGELTENVINDYDGKNSNLNEKAMEKNDTNAMEKNDNSSEKNDSVEQNDEAASSVSTVRKDDNDSDENEAPKVTENRLKDESGLGACILRVFERFRNDPFVQVNNEF